MTFIQTHTGKLMDLANPKVEDIDIEDIAQSLSMLARFNGHIKYFYTVAEHSIWVADRLMPEIAIYGLLHDAHEAYIGDITTPVAELIGKEKVTEYKNKIQNVIHEAFGLKSPCVYVNQIVKNQDINALFVEKRDLMLHDIEWPGGHSNVEHEDKLYDLKSLCEEIKEDFMFKFQLYMSVRDGTYC